MAKENPDMEPLSLEPDPEPIPLPIDEEAVELTEAEPVEAPVRKIQAFGIERAAAASGKQFKRPVNLTGMGATRCKMFHCKIAVSSMEYMEGQINDWIDTHEIEIKSVSQVVGVLEGKTAEPHIIVTVWY